MCSFSKPVDAVAHTRIFARSSARGGQFLAYQMEYQAREELAMILPLPTPPAPAEDAVRFIDLSGYPAFFDDAARGFSWPVEDPYRVYSLSSRGREKLVVHDVGGYQASFVPRIADFDRLDERFRMPGDVWESLPQYADWSFAVFKLKRGAAKVHPMAFEFPRRDAERLFFPTLHVHNGFVPNHAFFDHLLYCQRDVAPEGWHVSARVPDGWEAWQRADDLTKKRTEYEERKRRYMKMVAESPPTLVRTFMKAALAQGVLDGEQLLYRLPLEEVQPNGDQ
jgi:hypothetical protein